jgi:hypothetical protein
LWSLKPAEDGIGSAGVAIRVWNMAHAATKFTVSMGSKPFSARRATHIETPVGETSFAVGSKLAAAPDAMETYLLSAGKP